MVGICDLVTSDVSPLRRTAPDFADEPSAAPSPETLLNVTSNSPAPFDRATVREEIRAPPATPEPPPLARASSDNENDPTMDAPSGYQSERYADWNYSSWTWNRSRFRSSRKEFVLRTIFRTRLKLLSPFSKRFFCVGICDAVLGCRDSRWCFTSSPAASVCLW